jgi:TetR/AcrR family transcriptional regulator, repressor for neighboring sulfatase
MPRVRRDPDQAKRMILDAAADLLRAGGPAAVQVRAVAAKLEITDAAVSHHFGTRDQLLAALLRDAGSRVKTRLREIIDQWDAAAGVANLVDEMADVYRDGYGQLALALHLAGWRDMGRGMLVEVVDGLHRRASAAARKRRRAPPDRVSIEIAVACLHQALVLEPVVGHAFLRSVGLSCTREQGSALVRDWWTNALQSIVDG